MKHSSITITSEAFVLCAGLGTRMRPFTQHVPKPLLPVLGVPLLDFTLAHLKEFGIQKVVGNVHYLSAQIQNYFWKNHIQESDETQELLGSGGGYRKAMEFLKGERFFALNGDCLTWVDLHALEQFHIQQQNVQQTTMTLWIHPVSPGNTEYRGIHVSPKGRVLGLDAWRAKNVPFFIGAGLYEKQAFRHLPFGVPTDFVNDVLIPAIERNEVAAYVNPVSWWDIGQPESWWQIHMDWLQDLSSLPKAWKDLIAKKNGPMKWNDRYHSAEGSNSSSEIWKGCVAYGEIPGKFSGKKGISAFGEYQWFE